MKKVGKVCYGKYEGGLVYKEDKKNFFISLNNIKINIIDLRPDPNYEIDSTYYSMSDREAKNTGLSIGLGGFLGFMAFNGIKGSVSHTIYWLSGGYSNFEFDNADDEDASLEFFTLVHVMQFNETYWKKYLYVDSLYKEESTALSNWLEKNRKNIIYEQLNYIDDISQWIKNSKYFECFLYKNYIFVILFNHDIENGIYSTEEVMTIINKIANADTVAELEHILFDYISKMRAITYVDHGAITSENINKWIKEADGSVNNFSQFSDTISKYINEGKPLIEVVTYLFKEQYKPLYDIVKNGAKKFIESSN